MLELFSSHALDRQQLKEVAPTDLRVGMYVILNCSWFVHPFPTKNFQLTSKTQIQTIRGLGLKTVMVDLARSDPAVVPFLSSPDGTGPPSAAIPAQDPSVASADAVDLPTGSAPVDTLTPMDHYVKSLRKADQALNAHIQDGARLMKDMSSGASEGFAKTKQIVTDLGNLIGGEGSIGAIVSALNPEENADVNTLHALTVCALSMILGKHFKLELDRLRALGMGALFHDAGEGKLPATIRKARGRLTDEQHRQFEEHPFLGLKLAAKDPGFPALGFTIIQEHHERMDGSGYPFGLKGNKLSFLSHIVMVADEYDELINPPDPAQAMRPSDALVYLQTKRQQALPKDIVAALVETMGVNPPGSIVELSDGATGLVLSLGEPDRMRPMVVLMDAASAEEKPHIVDLASTPALTITRSLPKQEIPADTAQYLNFRRWAGYFVRSVQQVVQSDPTDLPKAA